jgi:hypothetical protein
MQQSPDDSQGAFKPRVDDTQIPNPSKISHLKCMHRSKGVYAECTPCPDGKGARILGMKNDALCRAGCNPGTFSDDGFNSDGGCMPCPGGKYQPGFRGTACLDCLAGSFAVSGASQCTKCAPGDYNNEKRSTACLRCDHGRYAQSVGSTFCAACSVITSTSMTGSNSVQNCSVATYRDFTFGNNIWGQLGVEASRGEYEVQPWLFSNDVGNPKAKLDNENVVQIVAGYSHTLVITQSGSGPGLSVWAFGSNDHGELGPNGGQPPVCSQPDSANQVCTDRPSINANPVRIPAQKLDSRNPSMVYAGRHSSYVLADGRVYSFGYSRYGQLGRPMAASWLIPTRYFANQNITSLAVGYYHVVALALDGKLYAFGSNR